MSHQPSPLTTYPFALGTLLLDLREHRGMTQTQAARDAPDIDQAAYSKYEHGRVVPSLETLRTLCDFFAVDRDVLVTQAFLDAVIPPAIQTPYMPVYRPWLRWAGLMCHLRRPLTDMPDGGRCCGVDLGCRCVTECRCECWACHVPTAPLAHTREALVTAGLPRAPACQGELSPLVHSKPA